MSSVRERQRETATDRFGRVSPDFYNWPAVREELDKIGYNGWMTVEGSDDLSLEEKNKRLDLIAEGK